MANEYVVTVRLVVKSDTEPDPEDFHIDWNNNLPYQPAVVRSMYDINGVEVQGLVAWEEQRRNRCTHKLWKNTQHCAEMACHNYIGKFIRNKE